MTPTAIEANDLIDDTPLPARHCAACERWFAGWMNAREFGLCAVAPGAVPLYTSRNVQCNVNHGMAFTPTTGAA